MAKKYPNTKWAGVDMNAKTDFTKGGITKNFEGLIFAENEVGYEAGYIAALMAQNDHSTTVSSVGGIPVPAVVRYIAGYQAGAKKAVPSITVLNGYSQDFVAQDKCKNIALDQISKGSDVVFQVAGGCGLGVLDAAKEKSVWGIGVDADQAYVNERVLTSAQKKVDVAVYTAIANLQKGKFAAASNLLFNAANGGVGLGIINKAVPTSIRLKTKAISLLVAHGVIKPPTAVLAEPELLIGVTPVRGGPAGPPLHRPPPFGDLHRIARHGTAPRPGASRDHEAVSRDRRERPHRSRPPARARCTRCSARTAPASRR